VDAYSKDSSDVWSFFDYCYDHQEAVLDPLSYHKTYEMMENMVGEWVTESTSLSESDYETGMNDSDIENNTR